MTGSCQLHGHLGESRIVWGRVDRTVAPTPHVHTYTHSGATDWRLNGLLPLRTGREGGRRKAVSWKSSSSVMNVHGSCPL